MSVNDIKTLEEFKVAAAEFKAKHPELPKCKPIECLNLIMRKEFAMQILRGEKKIEFRGFTEHYVGRLIDKDVDNWMQDHIDDEEAMTFVNHNRQVKKIHFHNYSNSWYLDIECNLNDYIAVTDEDVKWLQDTYDCHELDEALANFNKRKSKDRPMYFFFELGEVIDTNLKIDETK